MKIKSIDVVGVGGIRSLHIDFSESMNFISGPNGIGKTTILECIAHAFSARSTKVLKRNTSSDRGFICATIDIDGVNAETEIDIQNLYPDKVADVEGLYQHAAKLISLKVTRTIQYKPLESISEDPSKSEATSYTEAKSGINVSDVKNWFINRYSRVRNKNSLTSTQLANIELAISSFSLLDGRFSFSRVVASSNEIMVNTPSGEIYYEYLSSGFKSCLSIILGIIKEVELRFKKTKIAANDFEGIILIDELELHLHPEWQSKIPKVLVKAFPKAQFITTTHSPHVLQGANPQEIIALASNGEEIFRKDLSNEKYGFKGWTVEEILVDVMGMAITRNETYFRLMSEFESAIDNGDYRRSESAYQELDALLHPTNHLRKLLKFQMATVKS